MYLYIFAIVVAFAFGIIIGPFYIKLAHRIKFGQNILHYVESHKTKQGTPTMGGAIFLAAIILTSLCFFRHNFFLSMIAIITMAAYSALGFLDDFIKIKMKRNLGLTSLQKIIGQTIIAFLIGFYVYKSGYIGSTIILPFTTISINLGWGIIPFVMFVFIAITNSVNLTDGLDGLATGTSIINLLAIALVILINIGSLSASGASINLINENYNLVMLSLISVGALLAFNCFNAYPAKIFMGDTGSLGLGALIGSIAIFSRLELYMVFFGVMFIASSISVIIQVAYYKLTKKRVFLMAPLHHHFEKKGMNENKITVIYITITAIVSLIVIGGILLAVK